MIAPPLAPATRHGPTAGTDRWTMLWLVLGVLALTLPTAWDFAFGHWAAERYGHEFLVVIASAYLAWRRRADFAALPAARSPWAGLAVLVVALAWYVHGRSMQMLTGEIPSQVLALAGLVLVFKGAAGLRMMGVALAFLLFATPPPAALMLALTTPLKVAVSMVSVFVLKLAQYPVARAGVVITAGQYQLLVAEACAGLQTMFALEAVTLYYGQLTSMNNWRRALVMAVAAVPIGFVANTLRTIVLILITYHFGDAAGRGFLHGFAGLLLFAVALGLAHALGLLLARLEPARWKR